MSELFRYSIEKLSEANSFNSEHQMESFLFNNPRIIGVIGDNIESSEFPAIIRQFPTIKGKGSKGYIDLMALTSDNESNLILKLIELKLNAVENDFYQVKEYLDGLTKSNPYKEKVLEFIKRFGGVENQKDLDVIYQSAQGVFISCEIEPELIMKIYNWNKDHPNNTIDLYKLLYFKTNQSNYVVLDKILQESLKKKFTRISYNWEVLTSYFDDLDISDIFYFDTKYTHLDEIEVEITDTQLLLTLTPDSIKLMRDENYLERSKNFGANEKNFDNLDSPEYMTSEYFPKKTWNYEKFKRILSDDVSLEEARNIKIPMTNLALLVLLANDNNRAGWIPAPFFIHKKTDKSYLYYRNKYKEAMTK